MSACEECGEEPCECKPPCPDCNDTGFEGETRANFNGASYEDFKPRRGNICPNYKCEARDYRIVQEIRHAEDMREAMFDNPYEERHRK